MNKKTKQFCSIYCQPNPKTVVKKCYLNNQFYQCNRCTIKATVSDNIKEKGFICENLCDSIRGSACDIYGYSNNKLKHFPKNLLEKYGLKIAKKNKF